MPSLRKIGTAFVDLMVRKDTLSQDLKSAEQEVQQSTQKMEESASKVSDKFGETGKKISESTASVRKFTGAINETVGIATGILGAFTALGAVTAIVGVGIGKIAEAMSGASRKSEMLAKSVEEVAKRAAEAESKVLGLERAISSLRGESEFESVAELEDQLKAAQEEWSRLREEAFKANEEARRGGTLFGREIAPKLRENADRANEQLKRQYELIRAIQRQIELENERAAVTKSQAESERARAAINDKIALTVAVIRERAKLVREEADALKEQDATFDSLRRKQKVFYFERQQAAEEAAENARKEHAAEMERIAEVKRASLEAIAEGRRAMDDAIRKMSEGLGGASGLRSLRDLPAILDNMNSKFGTGY